MTEEQIIQLAKNHLEVLISDDEDGEQPTDFAATYDQLIEFAQAIYENGYNNGYSECSFDMGN